MRDDGIRWSLMNGIERKEDGRRYAALTRLLFHPSSPTLFPVISFFFLAISSVYLKLLPSLLLHFSGRPVLFLFIFPEGRYDAITGGKTLRRSPQTEQFL